MSAELGAVWPPIATGPAVSGELPRLDRFLGACVRGKKPSDRA